MDKPFWAFLLLLSCSYTAALADDPTSESKGWGDVAPAPSETECRSFIEAALKEQRSHEEAAPEIEGQTDDGGTIYEAEIDRADQVTEETADEASTEDIESKEANETESGDRNESADLSAEETAGTAEVEPEETASESAEIVDSKEDETPAESASEEAETAVEAEGEVDASEENPDASGETDASLETENEQTIESTASGEDKSVEADAEGEEAGESTETENEDDAQAESGEEETASDEQTGEVEASPDTAEESSIEQEVEGVKEEEVDQIIDEEQSSTEGVETEEVAGSAEVEEETQDEQQSVENQDAETSVEEQTDANESEPEEKVESTEDATVNDATEEQTSDAVEQSEEEQQAEQSEEGNEVEAPGEISGESAENQGENVEIETSDPSAEEVTEEVQETESAESSPVEGTPAETPEEVPAENTEEASAETADEVPVNLPEETPTEISAETESSETVTTNEEQQATSHNESVSEGEQAVVEEEAESPEQEDLTLRIEIPENLRPRDHIFEVLRLDTESVDIETKLLKAEETTLKDLKRLYEAAIKPLEILYKYRDLSNRHFGDPEIFSKPLILFMGPWSGGKSTIINYLLDNEYKNTALRTGAEPSPAYFNIVMWGEREEIMDGTQLAADWTFSGLQKFGQGLLDRLRGLRLNNPLLEKVNIVEIPGILEIRKQVERLFPLNDACQWFIDRADIIFLVYDPAKLDVGPETEAILDQLKGREYQTKIILNKADQVKPEELMRVQGTLIWNISPLMSSTEPPVMYSTSLWSHAYKSGAPSRLLFAQEKAFLKDLREAVDKRVENKISSARRFAVRVRNHAKMVDCYLTTYYNHKSFFGNKQTVSNDIIEHPQNYHIYEGLSTLTNISRYDLPDPDVYRDFFRLNPVYDFQQLASTCTYFRGCPINRLDVAIAYDLPELVGKYKKIAEDIVKAPKSTGKK